MAEPAVLSIPPPHTRFDLSRYSAGNRILICFQQRVQIFQMSDFAEKVLGAKGLNRTSVFTRNLILKKCGPVRLQHEHLLRNQIQYLLKLPGGRGVGLPSTDRRNDGKVRERPGECLAKGRSVH